MDHLPTGLVTLDTGLKPTRRLKRIDESKLRELHYDRLVVERVEELADLLVCSEMIDPDATLRVLGTQIDGIDVLLAEVSRARGELRRLVVVEDKLCRNPEARGQVLFQILNYARKLQEEFDAETLVAKLLAGRPELQPWLAEEAQHRRLSRVLSSGDFLLVVCGDRIRQEFRDLADYAAKRLGPSVLSELCLVSMALYASEDESEFVLVPNVVGLVTRAERDVVVQVEVTVKDALGRPVAAEHRVEAAREDSSAVARLRAARSWDEDSFFARAVELNPSQGGQEGAKVRGLRNALAWARSCPDLQVDWSTEAGASPTFSVRLEGQKTLFLGWATRGDIQIPISGLPDEARKLATELGDLLGARTDRGSGSKPYFDASRLADGKTLEQFKEKAAQLKDAAKESESNE